MNLNKVTLAGNLTRDPELKYTSGGTAVCNLSIAVNSRWTSKDGEKKEDTQFFNLTAWNKQAEIIAQHFTKGKPIYIEGQLKNRSWETESGEKRYATDVTVREFQFVGKKSGGSSGGSSESDVPF